MKRSISDKSSADKKTAVDARIDATVLKEVSSAAETSRKDADLAVQRGSQALARYASRKQFLSICRWFAMAALIFSVIGLFGYLAYPRIAELPWQSYFDRFDLRLQTVDERGDDRPNAGSEQTHRDDP